MDKSFFKAGHPPTLFIAYPKNVSKQRRNSFSPSNAVPSPRYVYRAAPPCLNATRTWHSNSSASSR